MEASLVTAGGEREGELKFIFTRKIYILYKFSLIRKWFFNMWGCRVLRTGEVEGDPR